MHIINLSILISIFQEALQFAFDAANVYAGTFERFRLFYKENEGLDLEALRQQDHGMFSIIVIRGSDF